MNKRRVVITGMGTLNAIGHSVNETWENLLAGKSGIELIKNFEVTDEFSSQIAGEVKNLDMTQYFDHKRLKKIAKTSNGRFRFD